MVTHATLSNISNGLVELSSKYDKVLIIVDLKSEMREPSLEKFCQTYNLECIVNKPTRFKNHKNPLCIGLMLSYEYERFLKAKTGKTELSDFHKMVVSVFKTSLKKQKTNMVTYHDCKHFNDEKFRENLLRWLAWLI